MNMKKILSTALVFVMLFASVVAVIPVSALASTAPTVTVNVKADDDATDDQKKAVCEEYSKYGSEYHGLDFETADEMLAYEISRGYIDSAETENYSIFVNRYTGFMYYKNNKTGQILTSNPIDPAYKTQNENNLVSLGSSTSSKTHAVLSQIELDYFQITDVSNKGTYNSYNWITRGSFISVSALSNGISVEYTLGEAAEGYVAPKALLEEDFNAKILNPALKTLADKVGAACGPFDAQFAQTNTNAFYHADSENHSGERVYISTYDASKIDAVRSEYGVYNTGTLNYAVIAIQDYAKAKLSATNPVAYDEISGYVSAIKDILAKYTVLVPEEGKGYAGYFDLYADKIPAFKEGANVVYMSDHSSLATLSVVDRAIKKAVPDYTLTESKVDEEKTGFDAGGVPVANFKVSIEYTFAEDGSLMVAIPEEKISYNRNVFAIKSISPLKYFGAGDMNEDGYIFFPDGSGSVTSFDQFFFGEGSDKSNRDMYISSKIYGFDYSYSTITGAHREQVTLPVFGLVNDAAASTATVDAGYANAGDKVTNGFFAIIEEGASLSSLTFSSAPATHRYANVFSTTVFYPSDEIDLAQSLSVSSIGSYTMLAENYYRGSYKTRYTMLTDDAVAEKASITDYYTASYVGMADYYRDYLLADGTLTALADTAEDLPLYIEALGSIDITKRILSFPVTVSTPLTTFEDVKMMYDELSDAIKVLLAKAEEYQALADALGDSKDTAEQKKRYQATADRYTELAANVQDIKNVNFRLTGFSNGGMYYTYPAKVKWEKSVGGKKGFGDLLSYANKINKADDGVANLSIYPDFDFMYIANTASFDGVSKSNNAAKMVDNRYASKQVYNSIAQKYETLTTYLVSTDTLGELYTKFNKKYSAYGNKNASVSTLGSDLNSNLGDKNVIVREDAMSHVASLLNKMSNKTNAKGYSLMTDKGNAYSLGYVDHILNISTDSSHFRYSSYTVPFLGMILHGYVSYAGSPLNYSGSPDYDILRAIENGASIYYILCTQNTNYLKSDLELSKYYGVDYENWFEKIAEHYSIVNGAIGDLQNYNIVDHKVIIAERIVDEDEMAANYNRLALEYIEGFKSSVSTKIDELLKQLRFEGKDGGINLVVDKESVINALAEVIDTTIDADAIANNAVIAGYVADIDKIIEDYLVYYGKAAGTTLNFAASDVTYESQYSYTTDSVATDGDAYELTDFSNTNGNVVMVTYRNADGDQVDFILNYNNFAVDVRLEAGAEPITLGANAFYRINK